MSKVKYNTSIDNRARRKTIVKVLLKIAVIFIAAFIVGYVVFYFVTNEGKWACGSGWRESRIQIFQRSPMKKFCGAEAKFRAFYPYITMRKTRVLRIESGIYFNNQ